MSKSRENFNPFGPFVLPTAHGGHKSTGCVGPKSWSKSDSTRRVFLVLPSLGTVWGQLSWAPPRGRSRDRRGAARNAVVRTLAPRRAFRDRTRGLASERPGRPGTSRISSATSSYEASIDDRQNPRQEWPCRSEKAIYGTEFRENRLKLHSATRRTRDSGGLGGQASLGVRDTDKARTATEGVVMRAWSDCLVAPVGACGVAWAVKVISRDWPPAHTHAPPPPTAPSPPSRRPPSRRRAPPPR